MNDTLIKENKERNLKALKEIGLFYPLEKIIVSRGVLGHASVFEFSTIVSLLRGDVLYAIPVRDKGEINDEIDFKPIHKRFKLRCDDIFKGYIVTANDNTVQEYWGKKK